jgi:glucuronoarabinoxylan endo-1,4-beta-xylanase
VSLDRDSEHQPVGYELDAELGFSAPESSARYLLPSRPRDWGAADGASRFTFRARGANVGAREMSEERAFTAGPPSIGAWLAATLALLVACGGQGQSSAPRGSPASGDGGQSASLGGAAAGGAAAGGAAVSTGGAAGGVSGGSAASGGAGAAGAPLAGGGASDALSVRLDAPRQRMDGFGISSMFTSGALSDADADALFDPRVGLGLSILRVGMAPTGAWLDSTAPLDAQKARDRGVTRFVASIPGAPASCKDNSSERDGGHLLAECYDKWAATMVGFARDAKQALGVDLYALSLGNEPDFASCNMPPCLGSYTTMLYTADEAVAFAEVALPKLRDAVPELKIMPPETRQWQRLWSNASAPDGTDPLGGMGYDYGHALARVGELWPQIDLLATHQYDTLRAAPWPNDVPNKPLWVTEMSGVKYFPEGEPSVDIDNGIAVAGWIHDAVVNGSAAAWLWFRYRSVFIDDNEGLWLLDGRDTKRHYTLGNFSRFVRPGYTRVEVSGGGPPDVLLSAFKGEDGTLVVVAINQGSDISLPVAVVGGVAPTTLTPWVTSSADDLAQKVAVPVSSGSLTLALSAKSVTTFVGK